MPDIDVQTSTFSHTIVEVYKSSVKTVLYTVFNFYIFYLQSTARLSGDWSEYDFATVRISGDDFHQL